MKTDVVDVLKNMSVKDDFGFIRNDVRDQAVKELKQLRSSLERVLLDVKFMIEEDLIRESILDDFVYQEALELMTPEFMEKFNNDQTANT
jgi:hypothetical protein